MYRNKTAVNNEKIGEPFNPKTSRSQGQQPFLKRFAIKTVTPQMVAYAAVQVFQIYLLGSGFDLSLLQTYIGLSSVGWGDKDGTFSLIHFYHLIVKTLSDSSDKWVVDTLAWWQRYVASHLVFAVSTLKLWSTASCLGMAPTIPPSPKRCCA